MFFFQLGAYALALQCADVIHEQLAFKMVDFMLDAGAQQAICFQLKRLAPGVLCLYQYGGGPGNRLVKSRD